MNTRAPAPQAKHEALLVHVGLGMVMVGAFFLFAANNDFSLFYHFDEAKKVRFITQGGQDFFHPLFMLQVNRLADMIFSVATPHQVVVLGRTLAALFATLGVLTTYLLARVLLSRPLSLAAAVFMAATPILVIHAHYLKEDAYLLPFFQLNVLAFLRFYKSLSHRDTLILGMANGLLCSVKYVGLYMVLLYLFAPLVLGRENKKRYYARFGLLPLYILATFGILNYPLFFNIRFFTIGFGSEFMHAVEGHTLTISPLDFFFSYHLLHSIIPGITPVMFAFLPIYLVFYLMNRSRLPIEERLMLLFALTFYLFVEGSPSKPFRGSVRYVLPMIPVLMIFCVRAMDRLSSLAGKGRWIVFGVLACSSLGFMGYDSGMLVAHLNDDTRARAEAWFLAHPGKALVHDKAAHSKDSALRRSRFLSRLMGMPLEEQNVYQELAGQSDFLVAPWYLVMENLDLDEARDNGVRYLVFSDFTFARYAYGAELEGQDPKIYERDRLYKRIFQCPVIEFLPEYRSFAYTNPVVRIVDLKGCDFSGDGEGAE